jgi:hypothetical protein
VIGQWVQKYGGRSILLAKEVLRSIRGRTTVERKQAKMMNGWQPHRLGAMNGKGEALLVVGVNSPDLSGL